MTMPRRRYWVIALLGVLLTVLALTVSLSPHEPSYHGKGLREWAQQYGSNHWSSGLNGAADREAKAAILAIGTNGIPFLLSLMEKRESTFWSKLHKITPRVWSNKLPSEIDVERVRSTGAYGLAALGTNASAAVPSLIAIGRTHPDEQARYNAVFALRSLGAASEPAIPFFIECLTNEVSVIRGDAALGLGYVHLRPEVVVPALIQYLERYKVSSSSFYVFEPVDAVEALARFETNAQASVPLLVSLLGTSNGLLLECITNRLDQIDPQGIARGQSNPAR